MSGASTGVTATPLLGRPASPYLTIVEHNGVAYLNGQLPYVDGELPVTGAVGSAVTVEQAQECARIAAHHVIELIDGRFGLERVQAVLRLTVYVASAPGFGEQPVVSNAASAVFVEALGERGRHARSAVGVAVLPKGAPVEVEATIGLTPLVP